MSESTVGEQFYSAIQKKAMEAVKDTLRSPLYPVQSASQGDFKWNWQNGQYFNNDTYQYVSARVLPGDIPGTVALSAAGGFVNAYDSVIRAVGYSLSTTDKGRLNNAQSNATFEAGTVVADYQAGPFGTITPQQMASAGVQNALDYVISYVLGTKWSGKTPPLSYKEMAGARNLRDLLPLAPASGDQVISDVANYLEKMQKVLDLQDEQQNASWILRMLKANTGYPSATNGGMQTFDPNNGAVSEGYSNGWAIGPVASIINDLQNPKRVISIEMNTSQSSDNKVSVHIEGQAGFSVGSWLQFSTTAGGSYDMSTAHGSSTECKASIRYSGYSLVPTAPAGWQQSTALGFYYPDPIVQAVANAGRDVTGYQFNNPPAYNLNPVDAGGTFGLLTNLLISNYPTVSITYSQANYSEFSQAWKQSVTGNLKLFGLIDLGSFSQGSYGSKLIKGSDNSTFAVEFAPSAETVTVPQYLKSAYVIGAAVANPGSGA